MDNRPIGVFDSGFGGLTAVEALRALRPGENIIYFGDSGRAPYGSRSVEELRVMARQNLDFLKSFDVKLILAACGTVSGSVLDEFTDEGVPVLGVIRPGAQKAASITESGRIGVIATEASIRSGAYQREIRLIRGGVYIYDVGCPKLVPLIEQGRFAPEDRDVDMALREYLAEMREAGADTLLLGCTHYPLMGAAISRFMGAGTKLVSAADEAALHLAMMLGEEGLATSREERGSVAYYTSGDAVEFSRIAELLLDAPLESPVMHVPPMQV